MRRSMYFRSRNTEPTRRESLCSTPKGTSSLLTSPFSLLLIPAPCLPGNEPVIIHPPPRRSSPQRIPLDKSATLETRPLTLPTSPLDRVPVPLPLRSRRACQQREGGLRDAPSWLGSMPHASARSTLHWRYARARARWQRQWEKKERGGGCVGKFGRFVAGVGFLLGLVWLAVVRHVSKWKGCLPLGIETDAVSTETTPLPARRPVRKPGNLSFFFFGLVWLVGIRDKRGDVLLWQNFMISFHRRRLEAGVVCPISDLRRHDASALHLSPNPDDFTNQPDDGRLGFHDSGPSLVDTSRQHPAGPRLTPTPPPLPHALPLSKPSLRLLEVEPDIHAAGHVTPRR